jgi:hypothetical protein
MLKARGAQENTSYNTATRDAEGEDTLRALAAVFDLKHTYQNPKGIY